MEKELTFNGSRDQAVTFILNFASRLARSYTGEAFALIGIERSEFSTHTQVRLKEIGKPFASGDIRIEELPSAKSLLLVRLMDDSADVSKWWKSCLDEMRKLKLLDEAQTTDATPQAQPTATWRGNGELPQEDASTPIQVQDALQERKASKDKVRKSIEQLWREGKTDEEIGDQVNLSAARIKQIRYEMQLKERTRKKSIS